MFSLTQIFLMVIAAFCLMIFCLLIYLVASFKNSNSNAKMELKFFATEQKEQQITLNEQNEKLLREISSHQDKALDNFQTQLFKITEVNNSNLEKIDKTLKENLEKLQKSNEEKLEKMRQTVDEQLSKNLGKHLNESFNSIAERLEQVHKGLGEMNKLGEEVGGLKKIFANVKTRGIWGETLLRTILEQFLAPEQYLENVQIKKNSNDRVEFAIKLPTKIDDEFVLLPIDSKFPLDLYNKVAELAGEGDVEKLTEARKELRQRFLTESKKIAEKYIESPKTTDFAILFVPTEGLYAEALNITGLAEELAQKYRIIVTGPTNLTALLNSLQIGFRSLAIQKHSKEILKLLEDVKKQFATFGNYIEKARKKMEEAQKELESTGASTRKITKSLEKASKYDFDEGQAIVEDEQETSVLEDDDE
ncbi:MAG: DNA recombination protein RmuC [Synergistaceae bacterium]|nr:DNA recombination protein RmuC [Synergistaceae bacterium]